MPPDPSLVARLSGHGQEHLLRWWTDLDARRPGRLVAEIEAIDLDEVDALFRQLVQEDAAALARPGRARSRSTACPGPTASGWPAATSRRSARRPWPPARSPW